MRSAIVAVAPGSHIVSAGAAEHGERLAVLLDALREAVEAPPRAREIALRGVEVGVERVQEALRRIGSEGERQRGAARTLCVSSSSLICSVRWCCRPSDCASESRCTSCSARPSASQTATKGRRAHRP
jgi:hypothetical protein